MNSPRIFLWLGAVAILACTVAALALFSGDDAPSDDVPMSRREAVHETSESVTLEPIPEASESKPAAGSRSAIGQLKAVEVVAGEREGPAAAREPWIRGRVLLPGGAPAKNARVGLLELKDGAPFDEGAHAQLAADGIGEFELLVPAWAQDRTVLLVARQGGSRPYSAPIFLGSEALAARHELFLEIGFTIEGRALRDGQPLRGASVGIDIAYGVPGIHAAGRECWWRNGRLEEKHANAETDADGFLRFTGLGPAEHRVQFEESNAPPDRLPLHLFHVTAPDERVYDLTGARLVVSVFDSAGRLEGAMVRASMEHGRREWESGPEPFVLEVPAESTIQIVAEHPAAEPVQRQVVAPGRGQWLDVPLITRRIDRPRLIVTLTDPNVSPFASLSLVLSTPSGAAPVAVIAVPVDPDPDRPGGEFAVDAVPLDPGPYLVSLEPGPPGTALSFRYPDTRLIQLPREGDVPVQLDFIRGGRCSIELLSDFDEAWSASYSLVNSSGRVCQMGVAQSDQFEDVEAEWEFLDGDMEYTEFNETETGSSIAADILDIVDHKALQREHSDRRAQASGVLRPGSYTLKVTSEELEPRTQAVEIKAGNVTIIQVHLVDRD